MVVRMVREALPKRVRCSDYEELMWATKEHLESAQASGLNSFASPQISRPITPIWILYFLSINNKQKEPTINNIYEMVGVLYESDSIFQTYTFKILFDLRKCLFMRLDCISFCSHCVFSYFQQQLWHTLHLSSAWRKNGNKIGQCVLCLLTSSRPMIESRGRFCIISLGLGCLWIL
jgi:hypothetical protein